MLVHSSVYNDLSHNLVYIISSAHLFDVSVVVCVAKVQIPGYDMKLNKAKW